MNANESGELTPTKIANLAIALIGECNSDPSLMKRVYETALTLLGVPLKAAPETPAPSKGGEKGTKNESKEEEPKGSSKVALTPEEAKEARKQFREKFGLQSLSPDQAKMALKIARDAKKRLLHPEKATVPKDGNKSPTSSSDKPTERKGEVKGSALKPDPNTKKPRVSEATPYISEGSRSTWNVRLTSQRQRAMERGVAMIDHDPSDPEYGFYVADYFNSLVTLKDTWLRFQNTWDTKDKKDPLKDLPSVPEGHETIVGNWFKSHGAEMRKRESGQFILLNESTATSLRPKN